MENVYSKCGEKEDANEKKTPQGETEYNKYDINIAKNKAITVEKQTSVSDENGFNNVCSTSVIVSDNKQPSGQKPDVSNVTGQKLDVSNVTDQRPNRSSKKKKRPDIGSSDTAETPDSSSKTDSPAMEKACFETFNEQTIKEFSSPTSHQESSTGNFVYELENAKGRVAEVRDSKLNNIILVRSVCLIQYPGGSGSGFRVGLGQRNLLCTAYHVVEGIMNTSMPNFGPAKREEKLGDNGVWCVFNYLTDDFIIREMDKFYFKPFVHYFNYETDIAILELKDNQYGATMPPPFTHFAPPVLEQPFHLIGHPNGGPKKSCLSDCFINVKSSETANHINMVRRWCQERNLTCEADSFSMLDNPKRRLFHVAENFTKGASGCPGLVIKPPDVYVVTVLLRGYPDWFYEPIISDEIKDTLPSGYRVEQGANLESLYLDMKDEQPALFKEIFSA